MKTLLQRTLAALLVLGLGGPWMPAQTPRNPAQIWQKLKGRFAVNLNGGPGGLNGWSCDARLFVLDPASSVPPPYDGPDRLEYFSLDGSVASTWSGPCGQTENSSDFEAFLTIVSPVFIRPKRVIIHNFNGADALIPITTTPDAYIPPVTIAASSFTFGGEQNWTENALYMSFDEGDTWVLTNADPESSDDDGNTTSAPTPVWDPEKHLLTYMGTSPSKPLVLLIHNTDTWWSFWVYRWGEGQIFSFDNLPDGTSLLGAKKTGFQKSNPSKAPKAGKVPGHARKTNASGSPTS